MRPYHEMYGLQYNKSKARQQSARACVIARSHQSLMRVRRVTAHIVLPTTGTCFWSFDFVHQFTVPKIYFPYYVKQKVWGWASPAMLQQVQNPAGEIYLPTSWSTSISPPHHTFPRNAIRCTGSARHFAVRRSVTEQLLSRPILALNQLLYTQLCTRTAVGFLFMTHLSVGYAAALRSGALPLP